MPVARLVETLTAPLDRALADPPELVHQHLIVQRGDDEVLVRDRPGSRADRRFVAPWPRGFGSVAVAPSGDLVVFAGVHALRAVDAAGVTRWEVRHGCWSASVCEVEHAAFDEYAEDEDHESADSGSAAFSSDGAVLWAHVRGGEDEEWLVLDPADGAVLTRFGTETIGSLSLHFPQPDPALTAVSIGEGEEDSPTLWGRWDGTTLTVERLVERVFLAANPSGGHFLTTDPGQWALYLHRASDGAEVAHLDGKWDYEAAFPWEDKAVAGSENGHRLIDVTAMAGDEPIEYPFPVTESPRPAWPGTWSTVAGDGTAIHVWTISY